MRFTNGVFLAQVKITMHNGYGIENEMSSVTAVTR